MTVKSNILAHLDITLSQTNIFALFKLLFIISILNIYSMMNFHSCFEFTLSRGQNRQIQNMDGYNPLENSSGDSLVHIVIFYLRGLGVIKLYYKIGKKYYRLLLRNHPFNLKGGGGLCFFFFRNQNFIFCFALKKISNKLFRHILEILFLPKHHSPPPSG